MAYRAPKTCSICSVTVHGGGTRCPLHPRDAERGTTVERGYDSDWRKIAKAKLETDPFCEIRLKCSGVMAEAVDHKIPIYVRPDLRLVWSNLQSCCRACNNAKRDIDRKTNWPRTPESQVPRERIEF